jgi:pyruvate formate lyase activating enzyme
MKIGGLQKLTLIDFPGKTAATVFLIGCNFRCPFCQNPELVRPDEIKKQPVISEKEFFKFLDSRKGFLDGICITGGEPTIHKDLFDFVKKIKQKGFLVKLDTNGSNPEMLKKLLNAKLLDFVSMDVKTSEEKYKKIYPVKSRKAGAAKQLFNRVKKSIDLIKKSKIDYEFRITVTPTIVEKKDIEEIGKWLKGVKKFALQQFRNQKVLDKKFEKIQPYSDKVFKDFQKILNKYIKDVELRL